MTNPNELCPTQNCVFQLEGGVLGGEYTPGERSLNGKLMINTGDTTRIRDLSAYSASIEDTQKAAKECKL